MTNFFSPTMMRSGDKRLLFFRTMSLQITGEGGVTWICTYLFPLQLVNLISDGLLIVSGCGQDRGQSLLLVR